MNASPTLPLTITSVSVSPISVLTGFGVTAGSGAATIPVGMSETFTIAFVPNGVAGLATASVKIISDDQTHPVPFLFEISATSAAPVSSMEVEGASSDVITPGTPPIAGNGTNLGSILDNGASATQTFTIVSNGMNLPLTISSVTVVPVVGSGFTVTAPLSTSVPAGSSTTFTVKFTPTGPGVDSANIEIASSDSSHPSPFIFEVTGTGVNPPPSIVAEIDDSNPTGFSTTGSWSTYGAGMNGSEHYAAAGTGTAQADYTFTGLTPGQYEVLGTWAPLPTAGANSPYTFYDTGKPVGAAIANQSLPPNGSVVPGWQIIGLVNITSTTLRVALSNDANGAVIADAIEIGPLPGITLKTPQLAVSDNLTGIATNSSPELDNGTDFGSTFVGFGSVIHTFTLTNDGLATLTFGGTPVRAVGASFSIVSQPAVGSLAPGASTTFQVKFTPTATGLQSGSIAITSNDPTYPSAYELFLQGTGAPLTIPEITQPALAGTWTSQSNGLGGTDHTAPAGTGTSVATYAFGGLATGAYQVYATWPAGSTHATNAPFTLYNGSTAVGTIAVNEKVAPSGPTYSGTTFQLLGTVNVTAGSLKATLSNKANGVVVADGVVVVPVASAAAQAARIAVTGDGLSIAASAAPQTANGTNFGGATVVTGSVTETFTISNTGATVLTLNSPTPITVTGSAGSGFVLAGQPAIDSLAPGASVTFQVFFLPTTTGAKTGTISIGSNDPVNPAFTINISGTGIAAANGQITVSGNSFSIAPGGTPQLANDTNFGSATVTTGSVTETYTIKNTGLSTLTLTGATPVSVTGAGFSVLSQPGSNSLAAGASTTFKIKFVPTAVGLQTGTVTIASNDPQNGTFIFNVQGTGVAASTATPIIIDDSGTGFSLVGTWSTLKAGLSGGEHYTAAAAGVGSSQATYSFAGLTPGQYLVYGTWSSFTPPSTPASNAPFTLYDGSKVVGSVLVNQQIPPSGATFSNTAFQLLGTVNLTSTLMRVTLNNNANGIVLADAVAIVKVTTAPVSTPQIAVSNGAYGIAAMEAAETTNGTNFGSAKANSGSVVRTFTITNAGLATLVLSGTPITVSGPGFSLVAQPAVSSLAAGASVTFQVKFLPTAIGVDGGTVTIASNDPQTPSLSFSIQGSGN